MMRKMIFSKKSKEIKITVNLNNRFEFKSFLDDFDEILKKIEKVEEEHSCNCTLFNIEIKY